MNISLDEAVAITAQDLFESEVFRERAYQLTVWGSVHDLMEHDGGEVAKAAMAMFRGQDDMWPWEDGTKPSKYADSPRNRLVVAAALIQAEVARLWRLYEKIADEALKHPAQKS